MAWLVCGCLISPVLHCVFTQVFIAQAVVYSSVHNPILFTYRTAYSHGLFSPSIASKSALLPLPVSSGKQYLGLKLCGFFCFVLIFKVSYGCGWKN